MHDVLKWSEILMKAIVKYRKHLAIAIASEFAKELLSFNTITIENTLKEINILKSSKGIQATDMPVIGNKRQIFFAEQICAYFNKSIDKEKFPNCLKLAKIAPVFKKGACTSKSNCRPVSNFQYSKILKNFYKSNFQYFLTISYQSFSAVFEKGMARKEMMDINDA